MYSSLYYEKKSFANQKNFSMERRVKVSVNNYKYLPIEGVLRGVLLGIRNVAICFKMQCGNNTKFQRKRIKHEQSKHEHLQQM